MFVIKVEKSATFRGGGGCASDAPWACEFASDHPHVYIFINIIPLVAISLYAEIQISFPFLLEFYYASSMIKR